MLARSLEGLAALRSWDAPESAVRLAGAADALRTSLGAAHNAPQRARLSAWLAEAEQSLGRSAFSAAWAAGHTLDLARVIAEALEAPPAAAEPEVAQPGWPAPAEAQAGRAEGGGA
jgi:hypothetical protein